MPIASGGAVGRERANAGVAPVTAAAPVTARVLKSARLSTDISVLPSHPGVLVGRLFVELAGNHEAGPKQRTADEARHARRDRADPSLTGLDRRVGVGRLGPLDVDGVVEGDAEPEFLFRAAETRVSEPDRPRIDDFAEVERRAVRVRRGPLAAELVEAVAEAVSFIAVLLGETARVE